MHTSRSAPAAASLIAAAPCFAYVVLARWGSCFTGGREACFRHEDDLYDYQLWQSGSPQIYATAAGYLLMTLLLVDTFLIASLINLGYYSHDTNPWTWTATMVGCLMMGICTLMTASPRTAPRVGHAAAMA